LLSAFELKDTSDNNKQQQQQQQSFIRLQVILNPLAPQVVVLIEAGPAESIHLKLHMNEK